MTPADALDDVWAAAGEEIGRLTFSDDYTIERPVSPPVSDGRGGWITPDETVESGKCSLWANQTQSREYISGQRVVSSADYLAELPLATTLVATDKITINGREFSVTGDPKRDGHWATSVIAELEARS